ncbi:HalOD1 output domain-containing protein [Halobacteriaceae archaeon SHR40]|uniref:HalOD1 output domain-containing protein n=1 Tax=Halovenus amylolytica TaxID=2500550 RepID=UPI000FE3BB8C
MADNNAETLCWNIVTAIAEERDIERDEINERIGDVIDTQALSRLAAQSSGNDSIELSVSFRIEGCYVTVTDGGEVRASCPGLVSA